ncbi:hypothetical protein OROHE_003583 [Orobanche hederae]
MVLNLYKDLVEICTLPVQITEDGMVFSHLLNLQGGTNYFTLDYVLGMPTRLPDAFTGPLTEEGSGMIIVRYGGKRIPVTVKARELGDGWEIFLQESRLTSGTTLLVSYTSAWVLSILEFKGGMGSSSVWFLNSDPFSIESGLLQKEDVPKKAAVEIIRTSFFPQYMLLFFASTSGVCEFEQTSYLSMKLPANLAHHLNLQRKSTVNIYSCLRVFEDITITLGHFKGARWSELVEACEMVVGFKVFFFINDVEEFEMIVIGYDNLEVIYKWARSYYKLS